MELAGFTICGWFAFLLTAFSVTVGGDRDEQVKQGDIEMEETLSFRDSLATLRALDDLQIRRSDAEQRLADVDANFRNVPQEVNGRIEHHLKKDVRIAFTASLTHSVQGLSVSSVIIFDAIANNLGKGYSNTTGIFTCPADGNYFIMASLMSGPGSRIHVEVVLDNMPKAAVFAQSISPALNAQSSSSTVFHCSTGQQIWVKVKEGSSVYGDMSSPLTQFTGYLIWED